MKALTHASRSLTPHEVATLQTRAMVAWLASPEAKEHPHPQQLKAEVITEPGRVPGHLMHYVVVVDGMSLVAAYRVRNDTLLLRRITRVPRAWRA